MTATDQDGDYDGVRDRPRLFWDCSMTAPSTSQAGIQRVVRNVTASAATLASVAGFDSRLVLFRDGHWRDVPTALHRARTCTSPNASNQERRGASRVGFWARRFGQRLYKIAYPRTLMRSVRRVTQNALGTGEPIPDFREDDILMLLDGSWLMPEIPRFEAARRAGTRIGLVVYDLLPISHPQFMLPKAQRQFTRWMRRVVPQTDFFVAISQVVRDEFRNWARGEFPGLRLADEQVSWFPLGVKLDLASPTGDVRPEVRAALDGANSTYLKVSTLDPRKNHMAVLDAFDLVWRQCPTARLCFVGRQGWLCSDLVRRISCHPRLGRQLFWFQGLTDAELAYCFGHVSGVISASLAEGYGLPIAESLQYGLPTFVSDIPVHREVGGDFCAWFDPCQPASLAQLLIAHVRSGEFPARRRAAEYVPTTWDEATKVLIQECCRLTARSRRRQVGSVPGASQPKRGEVFVSSVLQ